jgi:hypothetical protein
VGIAETIKGIQDAGIIACAKHYIGNEQVKLFPCEFPLCIVGFGANLYL